jgi:hypothetical protein
MAKAKRAGFVSAAPEWLEATLSLVISPLDAEAVRN